MTSVDFNDEAFDELLLAIDSGLDHGQSVSLNETAPEVRQRIAEARECMQLLSQLRTSGAGDTDKNLLREPPNANGAIQRFPSQCQRYVLIKNLGEGGFGTVYLAEDPLSTRQVAIKIPHLRSIQDAQSRKRFQTEARVLEQLRHRAIVSILDSGEHEELPFLVMEFCDSGNLTQLLAELDQRPSPEWCARLILQIAKGLGQAHSLGILHRDVKPHNVLLTRSDNETQSPESIRPRTSDSWRRLLPKLADFGLAKWSSQRSDSDRTRAGVVAGTPQYMAPEQAAGLVDRVSPATDVHGVGLVLYEMLTGQQPFVGDTEVETRWNIVHQEPTAIRKLRPAVPRDLETICHRALEKDPGRRFIDANDLAEDLERFINQSPIKSKPVSTVERVWRWCRRHPDRATMITVILCLVTLISIGGWWSSSRMAIAYQKESDLAKSEMQLRQNETRLRQDAEHRQGELIRQTEQLKAAIQREQLLTYTTQIRLAYDLLEHGQELESASILQAMRPVSDQDHDHRDFSWRMLNARFGGGLQPLPDIATSQIRSVNLIPKKNMIVAGTTNGGFLAWDASTAKSVASELPDLEAKKQITGIGYIPDNRTWVFSNYDPGSSNSKGETFHIRWLLSGDLIRHVESVEQIRNLLLSQDRSKFSVEFHQEGSRRFGVYSSITGERLWTVPSGGPTERQVAWSPDGGMAVPDGDAITIYNPDGHQNDNLRVAESAPMSTYCSVAFSPTGQLLAALRSNFSVDLWARSEAGRFEYQRNVAVPDMSSIGPDVLRQTCHGIRFLDNEDQLAFSGSDHRVYIWNLKAGQLESRSPKFSNSVASIIPMRGGKILLHEFWEDLYLWQPVAVGHDLAGHSREAWTLDFSPDGHTLVSGGDDGTVKLWNMDTAQERGTLDVPPSTVVDARFSPSGDRFVSLCLDGSLRLWNIDKSSHTPTGPPQVVQSHRKARCLAWSQDGRTLVTGGYDGDIMIWNAESLKLRYRYRDHSTTVRQILFLDNDQTLLTVSNDHQVLLWNLTDPIRILRRWEEDTEIHNAVLLNTPGQVALGLRSGVISIRDTSTGKLLGSLVGHQDRVRSMALSPDGQVLASGDETGLIRLWRTENLQLLFSMRHGQSSINDLTFSPAGDILAIADHEGKISLWRAPFVP